MNMHVRVGYTGKRCKMQHKIKLHIMWQRYGNWLFTSCTQNLSNTFM